MALPEILKGRLSVPAMAAPMFIISGPELVISQCKAGVVGSFPALNAREKGELEQWLIQITQELETYNKANPEKPAAPFAVNLILHKFNMRLEPDLALCEKYQVPIVITSLGARSDVNDKVHAYGGIVFHDIIHNTYAKKAIQKGADGLIAVAAGAGGHAGIQSPMALIQEIRNWFDGPLLLSGSIATGDSILAAQAMGADLAYIGSAFIATIEARAVAEYKDSIVKYNAEDIVYSNLFTGVHGNYLKPSIKDAGLDPNNLAVSEPGKLNIGGNKAWKDIWGCGQGIGAISEQRSAAEYIASLVNEYNRAFDRLATLKHIA